MHLNALFDWVNDRKGSCHLQQWIKDCLGYNKRLKKNPLKIEDFSGDTTAKIICLNFIKEIKYNMTGNQEYFNVILYLEDYLTQRKHSHPHPAFRIQGFSNYLSGLEPDLLCIGKKIKKKPSYFSHITTLQDIINHNIPEGSAIPIEDINEQNVREKIETINDYTRNRKPMKPLRGGLPLFWCTVPEDIASIYGKQGGKQNDIRNKLGLYKTEHGYLVEFQLSSDYISDPRKPVFFDSGPNEYFNVTKPGLKYGRTRRLSDFTPTEYKEAVHKEKDWPYDDEHFILPLGKLEALPNDSETHRKKALKDIWEELTTRFPETIQEIRDL
jgi:hypothetical protein